MRCIKTGCTLQCGDYNYHGDLFVNREGKLVLKGVPEQDDGSFCYLADGSEMAEVESIQLENVYERGNSTYAEFGFEGFSPYAELNSFFHKWEPELWKQLYTEGV